MSTFSFGAAVLVAQASRLRMTGSASCTAAKGRRRRHAHRTPRADQSLRCSADGNVPLLPVAASCDWRPVSSRTPSSRSPGSGEGTSEDGVGVGSASWATSSTSVGHGSTVQAPDIHVLTPARGSTQRFNTNQTTITPKTMPSSFAPITNLLGTEAAPGQVAGGQLSAEENLACQRSRNTLRRRFCNVSGNSTRWPDLYSEIVRRMLSTTTSHGPQPLRCCRKASYSSRGRLPST